MSWDPQTIKDNLLLLAGILVIVAALTVIAKSRNGQVRDAMSTGGIIAIAALVIAVGSHLEEVGNWLYNLIF